MTEPADNSIDLAPGVRVPAEAVDWTFSRSSGPGGQNVNKVNSRATLTVRADALAAALPGWAYDRLIDLAGRWLCKDPLRLQFTSDEHRSQRDNRRACLHRLRQVLLVAMDRPKPRRATRPSRAARERRLESKRRRSQVKAGRRGRWRGDD